MGRFAVEFKLSNNIDVALGRRGLLPSDQVRQVTIQGMVGTGTINFQGDCRAQQGFCHHRRDCPRRTRFGRGLCHPDVAPA
ncbi:hypothetical protein HYR99_00445 [Candidatus Poribacteria bacterium]|nr:hypothetical protein [Candidatus Poribacteria bacterium]